MPFQIALASLAHAAPVEGPRVETVLAAASRILAPSGVSVEVSPRLRGLYVYLDPGHADARTCMRALAKSIHASVDERSAQWTLERTGADTKAMESERVSERAGWIRDRAEGLAKFRASAVKGRSLDEAVLAELDIAARASEELSNGTRKEALPFFATELLPSEDLLLALISRIGAQRIAAVPVGGTAVWEDSPVAGASRLPGHGDADAAYETAMDGLRGASIPDRTRQKIAALGMKAFFDDWEGPHGLSRLRIQVRSERTRVLVTLEGYDPKGSKRVTATMIAMPTQAWRSPTAITTEAARTPGSAWVSLSPATLETVRPLASVVRANAPSPTWLTHPETDEPLEREAGDALRSLEPDARGRCVAIQASDALWNDVRQSVVESRLSLNALRQMMREWTSYERIESPEGIVWRPRGDLGVDCNAPRKALGAFVRSTLKAGVLDLRSLCVFHSNVGPSMTDVSSFYERAVRGSSAIRSFTGDASHGFYRLLGAISDASWRDLLSGSRLSVRALGALEAFAAELDEDRTPVSSATPFPDVLRHPRESFAVDDPALSIFGFEPRTTELLGIGASEGGEAEQWTDGVPVPATGVAGVPQVGEGAPMTRKRYEDWIAPLRLQTGYRNEMRVGVRFPNGMSQSIEFVDPIITTSGVVGYGALPHSAQDAIWSRAQRAMSSSSAPP